MLQIYKKRKERKGHIEKIFFHSHLIRFTIGYIINLIDYGTWVVSNCKYDSKHTYDIRLIKKEFIFYALAN